jgi:hypothetical protein
MHYDCLSINALESIAMGEVALSFLLAPPGWTPEQANPFTPDGSYGPAWSAFCLRDDCDWRGSNKRGANGLYALVFPRQWHPKFGTLATVLADFIRYENLNHRQVILSAPADLDIEALAQHALAGIPDKSVIRPVDPRWLVHSTPRSAWEKIQQCGELRSLARLRREGMMIKGVGFETFGEPDDYAEYVMLGLPGMMSPEFVVASYNAGVIITEPDTPYEPGARLFFDAHQLILEGLIVRDGLHLKVFDHLPLDPYLVAAVNPAALDPAGRIPVWTPRTFCCAALEYFSKIVGEVVPYQHWC